MNAIIENTLAYYQVKGYTQFQISEIVMDLFSGFN